MRNAETMIDDRVAGVDVTWFAGFADGAEIGETEIIVRMKEERQR